LGQRPLNIPQQKSLVGFLVVQLLRSPFFVEQMRIELDPTLAKLGLQDDPTIAVRAYDALYSDNAFYSKIAHPLMWSRWAVIRTKSPVFVLPDSFCRRADLGDGLRLIAPLTPFACIATLPSRENEKSIVPAQITANEALACRISSALVNAAVEEFISHPDFHIERDPEVVNVAELLQDIEAAAD
jgi:hypothetical protein